MRASRGRRSEAFWPSVVMKKWLNIKPKVCDFSEDDIDTETESEDDAYSIKDERASQNEDHHAHRTQGDQCLFPSQASANPSRRCHSRHRRGVSETLRVQYIMAKDVRVTICTWNVAGKPPSEDLEIDEWLSMKEPSDIYILGFQEVVPLNAGNVLGAEDSRPIPKWEAIIRRTLNKSLEPETIHKCYSAPPSPVLRTSSAADILAENTDDNTLNIMSKTSVEITDGIDFRNDLGGAIGTGMKVRLKRIYGIDSDTRLEWPEHALDSSPHILSLSSKLRRVSSSSGRIGFNLMENFASNGSVLNRSHNSSGNLGLLSMDQPLLREVHDPLSDISDSFSEEEYDSFLERSEEQEETAGIKEDKSSHPRYVRIVSKQMVGIYVSVWVRKRLRRHITDLKVSPVGVGIMGYMGNKGSVSVSMSLYQTRLCFVCSHLTSGHKDGDKQKRNYDVSEILRRTRFSSTLDTDQPQTIPSHDKIFWFGDLNYRLNMLDRDIRKLVAHKDWDELINSDQLAQELRNGRVFDGWKEGIINFPPTYKYEINSDKYVGENLKEGEGEKKRSPAWCDRILWLGKGIRQLSYKRAELKLSDHRPVSSTFFVETEVLDPRKLKRALNFTNAAVYPATFLDEEGELEL